MGLFPTFKKKIVSKNFVGGRILYHFTFYAIFNIKKNNIEKFPFTYWLNGRWDSWNLYPLWIYFFRKQFFLISYFMLFLTLKKYWKVPLDLLVKWEVVSPLFPSYDFVSQIWGGGGGAVMFFSHFMLFPTFLENKSGNTKQLFLI